MKNLKKFEEISNMEPIKAYPSPNKCVDSLAKGNSFKKYIIDTVQKCNDNSKIEEIYNLCREINQ